jgi:hypothetical protein
MQNINLRIAPSGTPIKADADGDTLLWDGATETWQTGPGGGGGALAGDANGPPGSNEVTSLTPAIGAPNVPIADLSSDAVDVRPVVTLPAGAGVGTISLFDLSTMLPRDTEFDFILDSRIDLVNVVAPVGGVFNLPDGSYFIRQAFALNAGESLSVGNGVSVLMMAGGREKVLSGDPTTGSNVLLNVLAGAVVQLLNVQLTATGNGAHAIDSAGELELVSCRVLANATGGRALTVTAGNCKSTQSYFESAGNVVTQTAGSMLHTQDTIVGGQGRCVDLSGAGANVFVANGCILTLGSAGATAAVNQNAASGDLELNACRIDTQVAEGNCITIQAASTVQVSGGKLSSNATNRGSGINIAGNIQGGLLVSGVHGENLGTSDASGEGFIRYTSGTVRRATVVGCDTATTVSTAINWASASMPTLGLSIVGNCWDDPTPFNGFTHTSARVNSKANQFQTGLMAETAIVP